MKTKLLISILALVPFISMGQVNDSIKALPKYGNDSVTCVTNLSLYREAFKQWKDSKFPAGGFDQSYHYWKWVYDNGPKASLNTYVDGVTIMSNYAKNAATAEEAEAYIDTIMQIYDKRAMYMGKKGYVLGRKGLDYMKYRPKELKTIYDILDESVALEGNSSSDAVLDALFKTSIQLYQEGLEDKSVIIDNYDRISEIIEYNVKNNTKEKDKYLNLREGIESNFEPYASCENLIPIYEKKFNETPEDIDLLKKISYMLDKKGCTSDKLFEKVSIQYHKLNPSPESAFMLGKLMLKNEDYDKAIVYLLESLGMEDDAKKYTACTILAHCYQQKNNFPEARNYALKAASFDPSKGEPYILIGQLYAMSNNSCNDPKLPGAVFWVAVDMFEKAKQVDSSVANEANALIRDYSRYFPSMDKIFFNSLQEGDTYTVGCWINRTTKIRAAK